MVTKNSIDSNIPIEISKGGTNATSFSTADGIVKYDGTRLVTSSTAKIDASNRQTNTGQPAFSAYLASTALNKTGNSTVYVIGTDALTEIYDQGGDFNVNGTFTAPITGKYIFVSYSQLVGCTIAAACTNLITTSNRLYYNAYRRAASNLDFLVINSCIADMDAGDTATTSVTGIGEAADTDDVAGDATNFLTGFAGHLLC
jgi:hypothetical protein